MGLWHGACFHRGLLPMKINPLRWLRFPSCGVACMILVVFLLVDGAAELRAAAPAPSPAETRLNISFNGEGLGDQSSMAFQLLLILTVLSLAPSIIIMMTSFTRIVVVLSFVRTAMGVQQPSNQIVVGLSMFLTMFIMGPVWRQIDQEALVPLREKKITLETALTRASDPLKKFMLQHTRERDLELFLAMMPAADRLPKAPATLSEWPLNVVVPAFMVSELRAAFQMGFVLFLPFLLIDLVVSSILMSMGMMMLPPVMVTLPLKLLVFVLADGWNLLVRSLVLSFQV